MGIRYEVTKAHFEACYDLMSYYHWLAPLYIFTHVHGMMEMESVTIYQFYILLDFGVRLSARHHGGDIWCHLCLFQQGPWPPGYDLSGKRLWRSPYGSDDGTHLYLSTCQPP